MALPDFIDVKQGPEYVFGEPTATDVTHSLSLNGLASGSARMSASADLGESFSDEYIVYFRVETATGTAPTAGNTCELWLVSSNDNSTWPGFVSGGDGAYPPSAQTAATLAQALPLLGPAACVLVTTPEADKVIRQSPVIWRPRGRYVVAVVRNSLGVAIKTEGTPASNDSRVLLVPRRVQVSET